MIMNGKLSTEARLQSENAGIFFTMVARTEKNTTKGEEWKPKQVKVPRRVWVSVPVSVAGSSSGSSLVWVCVWVFASLYSHSISNSSRCSFCSSSLSSCWSAPTDPASVRSCWSCSWSCSCSCSTFSRSSSWSWCFLFFPLILMFFIRNSSMCSPPLHSYSIGRSLNQNGWCNCGKQLRTIKKVFP